MRAPGLEAVNGHHRSEIAPFSVTDRQALVLGRHLSAARLLESWQAEGAGHAETIRLLRAHREAQYSQRITAGESWTDEDLIFCQADGTPHDQDRVYRRFRLLAAEAAAAISQSTCAPIRLILRTPLA